MFGKNITSKLQWMADKDSIKYYSFLIQLNTIIYIQASQYILGLQYRDVVYANRGLINPN